MSVLCHCNRGGVPLGVIGLKGIVSTGLSVLKPTGDELDLGYSFQPQDLHSPGALRRDVAQELLHGRMCGSPCAPLRQLPSEIGNVSVIQITASLQFDAPLRSGLRPAAMAPAADVGLTGPCAHAQVYAKAGLRPDIVDRVRWTA